MSKKYDLLIKNGSVYLPTGLSKVDIAIRNEKIVTLGSLASSDAESAVDAAGKLVLPGMIDPHLHFVDYDPDSGSFGVDDQFTASVAAAFGGSTTLMDFSVAVDSGLLTDSVVARRQGADPRVALDYALHVYVDNDSEPVLESLAALPEIGVNSVKAFMPNGRMSDDYALMRVMGAASQNRVIVMVHAEDRALVEGYQNLLIQQGRTSIRDYPDSRPPITEVAAVQRAILLAQQTGAILYVVHISTGAVVDLVRQAQRKGIKVVGETCPHYLVLDESVYSRPNGANYVCSPPIRTKRDSELLWAGVADGTISTIGSDHCGFSLAQKNQSGDDFRTTIKGLTSIETRGAVMFSEGVVKGRISLDRFVAVMATNSARVFGLYPKKGLLMPGSDADLVIIDPDLEWTITPENLHFNWGWNPHEELRVTGKPVMTILRGSVVTDGDQFKGQAGGGRFVFCEQPFNDPVMFSGRS